MYWMRFINLSSAALIVGRPFATATWTLEASFTIFLAANVLEISFQTILMVAACLLRTIGGKCTGQSIELLCFTVAALAT